MKEKIKECLKKLPGFRRLYAKQAELEQTILQLQQDNRGLSADALRYRLYKKIENGEPINVVFVCHRPAIWESLHSVYDALCQDARFHVQIVAIANKKQLPKLGLFHEQYESEGAEAFFRPYGCINGYDYETGQWLDLRTLQPDYVFFQTPYNICRPPQYNSSIVGSYARLCYIAYSGIFSVDEVYDECTPLDYLQDLSFFFTQHEMDHRHICERMKLVAPHHCQVINTGYPRYDRLEQYRSMPCDIWNRPDTFKIIWTPRWTTNEGNCHFFDFKDTIVDYCRRNDGVELAFRPHPQAFREWNATGELPEEQAELYKRNFVNSNMHLDSSSDYFPLLYSANCLITDRSTIVLDYYCTGNPIIYCTSEGQFSDIFPAYMEGMYCVRDWSEIEAVLTQLRQGIDPLQPVRQRIIAEHFIRQGDPAGVQIANTLIDSI